MTGPSFLLCALGLALTPAPRPEHFGAALVCHGGLRGPQSAAFARDGSLWVLDTGRHRLVHFDALGARTAEFGTRGSGPGEFLRPAGIALAPDGRVFVSDTGNDRIQVLADDGTWLYSFGERGRGPGQLCEPRGLHVDAQRVLVADAGNARLAAFSLEGEPWPQPDAGGQLLRPVDVALDPLARIYVLDERSSRVLRLDPAGGVSLSLGGRGAPFGLFAQPQALAFVGPRLFVSDRFNHRVQEFDLAGEFVASFPGPAFAPHATAGGLFSPSGLAVNHDGTRIAVCEPLEDRVQVFGEAPDGAAGSPHDHTLGSSPGHGLARMAEGAAGDGRLAAWVDPEQRAVQVYADGHIGLAPLTRLGGRAGMGVELSAPRDVAIDERRGWLHVSDLGRIWTFELGEGALAAGFDPLAARLVRYLEFEGPAAEPPLAQLTWPFEPAALVALPAGGLLAADERNRVLVRFDAAGRAREVWDAPGGEPFGRPVELVLDGERLYVSDADRACVRVLDLQGRALGRLEHSGSEPLGTPSGVLSLADGRLLVADRERDRVHVFDAEGNWLAAWGRSGIGPGELHQPTALLGAPEGLLRLIDCGNRRGQVLSPDGRFVLSF